VPGPTGEWEQNAQLRYGKGTLTKPEEFGSLVFWGWVSAVVTILFYFMLFYFILFFIIYNLKFKDILSFSRLQV